MIPKVSRIIKDIKSMKIQGAREVAKAGIETLEISARASRAKTKKDFFSDLQKTTRVLVKSRLTEPALRNVISHILLKVQQYEGHYELGRIRNYTLSVCREHLRELEEALLKIAEIGSEIIQEGDVVLTHCHSHTVVEILRKAKKQGKEFEVIVTETRPLYQGLLTAKDLLKAKIPVIYCIDSAAGHLMRQATKVLTGTDGIILPNGSVINKIGTFPIALLAKQFGKPFYVAGGTIKFTEKIELEERGPEEVVNPKKLPGAKIVNPAFGVTPAEYIEGIITEEGIFKPDMIGKATGKWSFPL